MSAHPTDYGPEPSIAELQAQIFRLEGEIKRLRSELDGCKTTEKDLGGIIRAQEDEIELLRAALEQAGKCYGESCWARCTGAIAREALKDKP